FTSQSLTFDDDTVDTGLHVVGQVGRFQHSFPVGGRGDDPDGQTTFPDGVQVAHRTGVRGHAFLGDHAQQEPVLPVPDPVYGLGVDVVVFVAFGQFDPAGGEEGAYAVEPGAAVDVGGVVLFGEWRCVRVAPTQEFVESAFPGTPVDDGGAGEYPVEIEKAGGLCLRQPDHVLHASGRTHPRQWRTPGQLNSSE